MHIGFIGTPEHRKGCGKTYYLVNKAYTAYLRGKSIHSNIYLNFPFTPIYPESFLMNQFDNCFILVDEIHNWFNSLTKGFQLVLLSAIINQTRKTKVDFGWSAQRFKDVVNRLRDDATVYACYKWHPDLTRCTDQEDECTQNHFITIHERIDDNTWIARRGIKITVKGSSLYDTNQIIPVHLYDSKRLKELFLIKQQELERIANVD